MARLEWEFEFSVIDDSGQELIQSLYKAVERLHVYDPHLGRLGHLSRHMQVPLIEERVLDFLTCIATCCPPSEADEALSCVKEVCLHVVGTIDSFYDSDSTEREIGGNQGFDSITIKEGIEILKLVTSGDWVEAFRKILPGSDLPGEEGLGEVRQIYVGTYDGGSKVIPSRNYSGSDNRRIEKAGSEAIIKASELF